MTVSLQEVRGKLERVVGLHGVSCAVFSSSDGAESLWIGDCGRAEFQDTVRYLFGGDSEISALFDSLEGRILPQSYQQGGVECVVSRVGGFVYGLFVGQAADPVAGWKVNKELRSAVDQVLEPADAPS